MKRAVFVLFLFFSAIISGCGSGLYFGPDAEVHVYNMPTVSDYTLTVVNSTPYSGVLYINGRKVKNIAPWGEHSISIRRYYINYYNSVNVSFVVRMFVGNGRVVSFSRRDWVYNNYNESVVWEITMQQVKNKIRYHY